VKTLDNELDKTNLLQRLGQLRPESQRQWGKMSPHQMVCHLTDSFKAVNGERNPNRAEPGLLGRTLVRWIALYAPFNWPHGVPTRSEVDQEQGGTPPVEFARDVDDLKSVVKRFMDPTRDFRSARHPMFGEMSPREWRRWGYLHMDHHLRQFGL